jgi:hypothetical protein
VTVLFFTYTGTSKLQIAHGLDEFVSQNYSPSCFGFPVPAPGKSHNTSVHRVLTVGTQSGDQHPSIWKKADWVAACRSKEIVTYRCNYLSCLLPWYGDDLGLPPSTSGVVNDQLRRRGCPLSIRCNHSTRFRIQQIAGSIASRGKTGDARQRLASRPSSLFAGTGLLAVPASGPFSERWCRAGLSGVRQARHRNQHPTGRIPWPPSCSPSPLTPALSEIIHF